MIFLEDLLCRYAGLDRRELIAWVENRWVLPERHDHTWIFHEVDVARVELILEIRQEFAIEDDALSLVLGLLDQVYDLRRQLGRLCDAVAAQPPEIQTSVKRALPSRDDILPRTAPRKRG
jgi:chaperone modulatory protein CbpM